MFRNLFRRSHHPKIKLPAAPPDRLGAFVRSLRPISVGVPLVRVGPGGDGGYLLPDDLEQIGACFSPGVGALTGFEEALARQWQLPCFMADDVAPPRPPDGCAAYWHFERKFLGLRNDEKHIRLEDWVRANSRKDGRDLMLQMDIDGAEYAVLMDAPQEILRRFRIMAVEFHELDLLLAAEGLRHIGAVFEKILNIFCVAHIHPNNVRGVKFCGDIAIPPTMEFTFYRKDRARPDGKALQFPHPLDRKNAPHRQDLVLPRCWQ